MPRSLGEDEPLPLYLGVSLESDQYVNDKVADAVLSGVKQLSARYNTAALKDLETHMERLLTQSYEESQGWKLPLSYHMTTLFIGNDASKTQSDLFCYFKEGQ